LAGGHLLCRWQLTLDDDVIFEPLHAFNVASDLTGSVFLNGMINKARELDISAEGADFDFAGIDQRIATKSGIDATGDGFVIDPLPGTPAIASARAANENDTCRQTEGSF
jgi:hypothetical protein